MKVKNASHWGADKAKERYAAVESTEMSNAPKSPTQEEVFRQARAPMGRGSFDVQDDLKATNRRGK